MGRNGQMEQSISFGPVHPRIEVHLEKWTTFFETFPVGPDPSIQFQTDISEILVEWIAPIVITRLDEGSGTVVMDKEEYLRL